MKGNGFRALAVALLLALVAIPMTGCFREVLYGNWDLQYTSKVDGSDESKPPSSVVMTLMDDGTVLLYGSPFGTFTRDRDNFTLTIAGDDGEEEAYMTGGWEDNGSNLTIYPDGQDLRYVFAKVAANTEAPAE